MNRQPQRPETPFCGSLGRGMDPKVKGAQWPDGCRGRTGPVVGPVLSRPNSGPEGPRSRLSLRSRVRVRVVGPEVAEVLEELEPVPHFL